MRPTKPLVTGTRRPARAAAISIAFWGSTSASGDVLVISAADPLNLTGIVTSGDRVRAVSGTRIAYRDGIAVSMLEGDFLRPLSEVEPPNAIEIAAALAGRRVPVTSGFVGRTA